MLGIASPAVGPPSAKQRYFTLDAMRGLAAMVVVMRHFGEAYTSWQPAFSFQAVDLFFVLSGFVLSLNYDGRFASGMTTTGFMRLRIIRVLPMLLVGTLLAAIGEGLIDDFGLSPFETFMSSVLTAAALPVPPLGRSIILFPLNTAVWSLFFELWIANLAFALFWRQLHGRILWLVILASAVGLVASEREFHYMDTGWGWHNIAGGFPRVGFSFFVGVAIARLHALRPCALKIPSWTCLCLLAVALFLPVSGRIAQLFSLVNILLLFPALIYFGAVAVEENAKLGSVLGDSSYAVYTIHVPLLVIASWTLRESGLLKHVVWGNDIYLLEAAFILGVVLIALILDAKIDLPMRRSLLRRTNHWVEQPGF
jgi:peptidoglycan/LPS O-acetylase OafA/YrhL